MEIKDRNSVEKIIVLGEIVPEAVALKDEMARKRTLCY